MNIMEMYYICIVSYSHVDTFNIALFSFVFINWSLWIFVDQLKTKNNSVIDKLSIFMDN